jgi:hypothetical protein
MKRIAILAPIFLSACAAPLGTVIPLENGLYIAQGVGPVRDYAVEHALYTADSTCKGQNKRHVVIGQKVEYRGTVSEGTAKFLNDLSQNVANTTGKYMPTMTNADDYKVSLQFKCVMG